MHKEVRSFIIKNKKYLLVTLLAVGLFVWPYLSFNNKALKYCGYIDGNAVIKGDANNYSLGIPPTSIGSYYSLSFDARSYASGANLGYCDKKVDVVANSIGEGTVINLTLRSRLGDEKLLEPIAVSYNEETYQNNHVTFKVDHAYDELIVTRANVVDSNDLFMRNIKVRELGVNNDLEASKVKVGLSGEVIVRKASTIIQPDHTQPIFTSGQGEEMAGQIFQAESSYLAGVGFRFKVKGKGGLGSYFAELHTAERDSDGNFTVSPAVLAKYEFHSYDAGSYLNEDGDWRIPLAEQLYPGKYYFVGINQTLARTNLLNKLEILGTKDKTFYKEGGAVTVLPDGATTTIGQFAFKAYEAKYQSYNDERLLSDSTVEDLGDNIGYYYYNSKSNYLDYLDLDSKNLGNGQGKVFFNENKRVVMGTAEAGTSFTYRLNTVYSVKNFYLSANQLGRDYYNARISYSFDGKKWQEIKEQSEIEKNESLSSKSFTAKIPGDNFSHNIYIQVTYDTTGKNKKEGLFGIKDLEVIAEVNSTL